MDAPMEQPARPGVNSARYQGLDPGEPLRIDWNPSPPRRTAAAGSGLPFRLDLANQCLLVQPRVGPVRSTSLGLGTFRLLQRLLHPERASPRDALTDRELRVLVYLPTNLSAQEIGRELHLSVHTVKTHMSHLYAKLGVHRRSQAIDRAIELGLMPAAGRLRSCACGRHLEVSDAVG